jgi:hypothetical protein
MTDDLDAKEMAEAAKRAVSDNARHSRETLHALLCKWFPAATDEQIEAAVGDAL